MKHTPVFILFLLVGLPQFLFGQVRISINESQPYTNSTNVKLGLFYADATEMRIQNGLSDDASWQPFQKNISWILPEGDGKKDVTVRFKLADGTQTEQFVASIIIDTKPPTDYKIHFHEARYVRHISGNELDITAKGAVQMMLSNDVNFIDDRWIKYDSLVMWKLTEGDGEKMVYAKFRDHVGNETEVISCKIILDATPPKGNSFIITADEGILDEKNRLLYTNNANKEVDLEFFGSDAEYMMISNIPTFYEAKWMAFRDFHAGWKLKEEGSDGIYTVYVKFTDKAGNESQPIFQTVIFDMGPPMDLKFQINNDAPITNKAAVKLNIFARGANFMRIGNDKDLSALDWELYGGQKDWVLEGEDGLKSVYIQYRDSATNETEVVIDNILLDRVAPKPISIQINSGDKRTQNAKLTIEVKAESVNQMQVSFMPSFKGAVWVNYKEEPFIMALDNLKGERKIYARFRDEAGNISETISSSIIYEIVPVNCKVTIDENARFTIQPEGKVLLTLNAQNATEMMIDNHEKFRRAKWQPYKTKVDWQLDEGDGERTVYAKFRTDTETESAVVTDQIIADRRGPFDLGMTINDGKKNTFSNLVTVKVKAQDAQFMEIATDAKFANSTWENYDFSPKSIYLKDGGGWRTIYTRFRDETGNISETITDSILVELTPMDLKFAINNDAEYCTNKAAWTTLQIWAQYATEMMISNTKDFSDGLWEPYNTTKKWQLADSDGIKQVAIKFRSHTGTESKTKYDYIVLDRIPPQSCKLSLSTSKAGTALDRSHIYASVSATDVAMMQLSNAPQFRSEHWTWSEYSDLTFSHNIGNQSGDVTVWVRFRDAAGNISEPVTQTIFIDTQAPKENIIGVVSETGYINAEGAKLAFYSKGAVEMRLGNTAHLEHSPWVPYSEASEWKFEGEDGIKYVYVQFKDKMENISKPIRTSVELDRIPPSNGYFKVIDEFCTSQDRKISLEFSASGASRLMVSNNPDFTGGVWQRLKLNMRWQLADEDGMKTVYAKFADEAGNESEVFTDEILLDRQPPIGGITINNDDESTTDLKAELQITYGDAKQMMVSHKPTFDKAIWSTATSTLLWEFTGLDGAKSIYLKLIDEAGNESEIFSDSIWIDTEAPIVRTVMIDNGISAVKAGKKVMLQSKVMNADFMMVSNTPDFATATWEPFFAEKEWKLEDGEGLKRVYFKFKDQLGNESQVVSDQIQVYEKLFHVGN